MMLKRFLKWLYKIFTAEHITIALLKVTLEKEEEKNCCIPNEKIEDIKSFIKKIELYTAQNYNKVFYLIDRLVLIPFRVFVIFLAILFFSLGIQLMFTTSYSWNELFLEKGDIIVIFPAFVMVLFVVQIIQSFILLVLVDRWAKKISQNDHF